MRNAYNSELIECAASLRMLLEEKARQGEKWIINPDEVTSHEKKDFSSDRGGKTAPIPSVSGSSAKSETKWLRQGGHEVVFLRLCPSKTEEDNHSAYSDEGALKLEEVISAMKSRLKLKTDVYKTYLVPFHKAYLSEEELQEGLNRFYQEMEDIRPRVVVCWGERISQLLTGSKEPVEHLRETFIKDKRGFVIMASWDPYFLLKKPESKRQVWADIQKVMGFLRIKN
ncbi:MAG: hypothetical protein JW774_05840 [Candidatus Aureabacteria bacterium]|nr:hypothetical protein [Candidatus Auribacterota bacterium]